MKIGGKGKRINVVRGRKIGENSVDEIESVRMESRIDPRDMAAGLSASLRGTFDRLPAWSMGLRVCMTTARLPRATIKFHSRR